MDRLIRVYIVAGNSLSYFLADALAGHGTDVT